jgi:hypothetical protein
LRLRQIVVGILLLALITVVSPAAFAGPLVHLLGTGILALSLAVIVLLAVGALAIDLFWRDGTLAVHTHVGRLADEASYGDKAPVAPVPISAADRHRLAMVYDRWPRTALHLDYGLRLGEVRVPTRMSRRTVRPAVPADMRPGVNSRHPWCAHRSQCAFAA